MKGEDIIRRNIVRLFKSRKGHLSYRIKRDYISDYSDVISTYNVKDYETLDPSYKYPMELEEVYAGLLYSYKYAAELNVDPDNIVIEGESAGGGLTARLALYNKDKGEVPLKGQVLIYPMLDYRTGGKDDIYNNDYARKLMEAGIFTELHVEPGVPHAYEYLAWTPQAKHFLKLRNNATLRMLGAEKEYEESAEEKEYKELFKYIIEQSSHT